MNAPISPNTIDPIRVKAANDNHEPKKNAVSFFLSSVMKIIEINEATNVTGIHHFTVINSKK